MEVELTVVYHFEIVGDGGAGHVVDPVEIVALTDKQTAHLL